MALADLVALSAHVTLLVHFITVVTNRVGSVSAVRKAFMAGNVTSVSLDFGAFRIAECVSATIMQIFVTSKLELVLNVVILPLVTTAIAVKMDTTEILDWVSVYHVNRAHALVDLPAVSSMRIHVIFNNRTTHKM